MKAATRARRKSDRNGFLLPQNREALRPPERLTVSQWAERHRWLDEKESAEPGRWKNRLRPYLAGPMDAFTVRAVERVVCVFAAQVGKTELQLNCLGYLIDQDPGTTMLVYASERQADKIMAHRVHPLIQNSPALRRYVTRRSDLGVKEVDLERCHVFTAWSNSPSALSSTPCRYVILDEVDKYPPFAGREANPIELAAVRTRTFRGRRKILVASTPTLEHRYIWSEYLRSDQNRFHVPCPHCGRYQELNFFKGLQWEKKVAPLEVAEQGLAWYVCAHCAAEIREASKRSMLARGRWVPRDMTVNAQGELEGQRPPGRAIAGYQLSVLYSPQVSWGEVAAKFLESIGDHGRMMDFWNSWLALPWLDVVESVNAKKVHATKRDYPPGVVPAGARVLTMGVDVQADCFWFAIRAWGPELRSWLVHYGAVQTWDQLAEILGKEWPREGGGEPLRIRRALVDSGFRTKEVYTFCGKHHPAAFPTKGSNNPGLVASWRAGKPEPGVALFTFKADHFKDQLATFLSAKPGERGEWMVHREIEEDPYVRHLTSERRVLHRRHGRTSSTWEPLTDSAPNHLWDCEVLNVFAAEMLHVRFLEGEGAPAAAAAPQKEEGKDVWVERDPGWLAGESVWS